MTVTIEKTSKKWKLIVLLGLLGFFLSIPLVCIHPAFVVIPIFGLSAYTYGRIGAWWNHG